MGKSSIYSVKSGYLVAKQIVECETNSGASSSTYNMTQLWKVVWKLKVPPKIKYFVWKVLSNAIPSFENLF